MTDMPSSINQSEILTAADYIQTYRNLSETAPDKIPKSWGRPKISILSSFTINGIKEILSVKCHLNKILPEVHIGDYNQYNQEILNPESELYKFRPDLVIIFIDIRSLLGDLFLMPYSVSTDERISFAENKFVELKSLINTLKSKLSSKILFHNFEVPAHSPLGILENKQKFGLLDTVGYINSKLKDAFKDDHQVFIFDFESFISKIGKQNIMDPKMYYIGDIKFDLQHMPALCEEYLSFIKPLVSLTKKCIVLDLDNTLWGGLAGEEGIDGIKLGPTPEGRSFLEFQKYLLSLYNRGVILAINSKNNPEDALKIIRDHPYMVLKENHFASVMINWEDKASNIESIAQELNIGLNSLVFIDDDKFNRELVKRALPEVTIFDLPDDPALYLSSLVKLNDFNSFQLTEEDKKKGQIYAEQQKRQESQSSFKDLSAFIKDLAQTVVIEEASSFTIPRISQLVQKTNQFNMTTRRHSEEDIKGFTESEKYLVVSAAVLDKFGDNGITGALIIKKDKSSWEIDTFLLSCRVIGRYVEDTLLAYVVGKASKKGISKLKGVLIPTKKNMPAKNFYKKCGFFLTAKEGDTEIWEYTVANGYKYPDFIKVEERGKK